MFSPPLRRKDITHGTVSGYRYWSCRCALCKRANADAQKANRKFRKAHGLCAYGSHPAREGKTTCEAHGQQASQESMAREKARKQKAKAAELVAALKNLLEEIEGDPMLSEHVTATHQQQARAALAKVGQ